MQKWLKNSHWSIKFAAVPILIVCGMTLIYVFITLAAGL